MDLQNQIISLDLTIKQINIVIAGLAKLPIETGLETFNVVQQQAEQKVNTLNEELSSR